MLRTQLTSSGCSDSWCLTSCFVNLGDLDGPDQRLPASRASSTGFSFAVQLPPSVLILDFLDQNLDQNLALKTSSLKCHCGVFSGAMAVLKSDAREIPQTLRRAIGPFPTPLGSSLDRRWWSVRRRNNRSTMKRRLNLFGSLEGEG